MNKKEFTYGECLKIASKYSKRRDFKNGDRTCFNYSRKKGWYNDITKHIKTKIHKSRTFEEVSSEAKKYSTKMDFKNNDMNNYCYAVTHGWLDSVCSHMKPVGDRYKRCIYVYELPDKVCYVGLTYDLGKRHLEHINKKCLSSVRTYCELNNIVIPKPKQLTDYVDSEHASKLEGEYLMKYINEGWKVLNVSKTGGLGGKKHIYKNIGVDIGLCKKIALSCETPTEFMKKHRSLYTIAKRKEWLEYIFSHFDKEEILRNKGKKISASQTGKKKNISYERMINSSKAAKPVLQYDVNGNFIREFRSQGEASKVLGHPNSHSDIGRCCSGKLKTCLGYVWRYK